MSNLLDVAIVGAGTGALMYSAAWVANKFRRQPPSMTHEEMIAGLQAMVDDPTSSSDHREGALARLKALGVEQQ